MCTYLFTFILLSRYVVSLWLCTNNFILLGGISSYPIGFLVPTENICNFSLKYFCNLQDRNFPNTLIEMKRLAEDSNRFRVEEIPPRLREKEKLFAVFKDLERQMRDMNFELDRDLYPDNIERSWSQLMMLYQVTDDNRWVFGTGPDRPLIKTGIEFSQDLRGLKCSQKGLIPSFSLVFVVWPPLRVS